MFDALIEQSEEQNTVPTNYTTFDELNAARQAALPQKMEEIISTPGFAPQDMNLRFSEVVDLEMVENATIVVIGAGHIGSHLVKALVANGYRSIHVFDFDHVEPHNVGVQDHTLLDAYEKKSKVMALRDKMLEFRAVEINPHECMVNGFEDIFREAGNKVAAIFVTVDNMKLRNTLFDELPNTRQEFAYIDIRVSLKQFTALVIPAMMTTSDYEKRELYKPYMFSDEEGLQEPCGARAILDTGAAVAAYSSALLRFILGKPTLELAAKGFYDMGSDCPFKWTETFNTFEWRTLSRNPKKVAELTRLREVEAKAKAAAAATMGSLRELPVERLDGALGVTPLYNLCNLFRRETSYRSYRRFYDVSEQGTDAGIALGIIENMVKPVKYFSFNEIGTIFFVNGLFVVWQDSGNYLIAWIALRDGALNGGIRKDADPYAHSGFTIGEHIGHTSEENYQTFWYYIHDAAHSLENPSDFLLAAIQYIQVEGLSLHENGLGDWLFDKYTDHAINSDRSRLTGIMDFVEECSGEKFGLFARIRRVFKEVDTQPEDVPSLRNTAQDDNLGLPDYVKIVENTWCKFHHAGVLSGWAEVVATVDFNGDWTVVHARGSYASVLTQNVALRTETVPDEQYREDTVTRVVFDMPKLSHPSSAFRQHIQEFHA